MFGLYAIRESPHVVAQERDERELPNPMAPSLSLAQLCRDSPQVLRKAPQPLPPGDARPAPPGETPSARSRSVSLTPFRPHLEDMGGIARSRPLLPRGPPRRRRGRPRFGHLAQNVSRIPRPTGQIILPCSAGAAIPSLEVDPNTETDEPSGDALPGVSADVSRYGDDATGRFRM